MLFNRLFSSLTTRNGPLYKKEVNVIKSPENGRREEHEQVAVYFDVMGFPSRRGRDVIGQDLAVLTNQRLIRAALASCVKNVFICSVINTLSA